MAQQFLATHRIRWSTNANGLTHTLSLFVLIADEGATPPTITTRLGTSISWKLAVDSLLTAIDALMGTDSAPNGFFLEKLVSGSWNLLDTYGPSQTGSGSVQFGWQATLVLRDMENDKLKVVFLEPNINGLYHKGTLAGTSGNANTFCKEFTPSNVSLHAPYEWAVSRSNGFIKDTGFVGYTHSGNRRVRRARGLT